MGTFSTAEPTNVAGWSEEVSGEIVSMYNQGKYGYAYYSKCAVTRLSDNSICVRIKMYSNAIMGWGAANKAAYIPWGSDGTESIGALMERQRVYFERGDHARIDGKMQVHHRLAFDEEGIPMLYVFNTCKHFIRTVPNLVYDEKNVEDINTEGEDHIYDELRYVCMKNPIAPRRNKPPALVVYDPLDLGQDQQYDRYDFYRRY